MRLSRQAARQLLLAAQGLQDPPAASAGKPDLMAAIDRMGLLQIDTISVVARSPYLVLWSRLGHYQPHLLDELLADGELFEYWSHAACFLPIGDFGVYRRLMLEYAEAHPQLHPDHPEHQGSYAQVLAHIRERGEVRSATFERQGRRSNGWWDWKPEKVAMERLYDAGILMIARREGFQRVYDLRERVLPQWDDTQTPSRPEGAKIMVLKAAQALGVATPAWVAAYFPDYLRKRTGSAGTAKLMDELAAEGRLQRIDVEGLPVQAYLHPDNLARAGQAANEALRSSVTTLLSPFDPVVSDRARAETLFGFEYRIEVYTPAERRRFGYFTLPILHRGDLVGRLDPKAHRKTGVFEVRAIHLEAGVEVADDLVMSLAATLRACADWHGTPEVIVRHANAPDLAFLLQRQLDHP